MSKKPGKEPLTLKRTLPWLYLIFGAIGLLASLTLTYDKIHVLKNPSYNPACNINPILSCGSVMKTEQASLFGMPNTIFGIMAFTALITIAVVLMSGSQLHKRIWQVMLVAASLGVIFMHYLFFQGVFRIHAICPWCFVVWMITIPIFWYTLVFVFREKYILLGRYGAKVDNVLRKHHGNILLVWYLIIFGILLVKFWYYWSTLL